MTRLNSKLNDLGDAVAPIGEYLAEQRRQAKLSMRQLAKLAGVSNPYLSQIERGLRKPSADVLGQLAKALQISAGSLYVRAGMLDPDDAPAPARAGTVVEAIVADRELTDRQKSVLIEVYTSFVDPAGTTAAAPTERSAARQRTQATSKAANAPKTAKTTKKTTGRTDRKTAGAPPTKEKS